MSLGNYHTALLYNDNTVLIFGSNVTNQSNMNNFINQNISKVSVGEFHSGVLYNDNKVAIFGFNK